VSFKSIVSSVVLVIGVLASPASYADPVWIDVRSFVEHKVDSIEGDIRISHSEIVAEVSKIFPDKDTEIRLYCRSGGRAEYALSSLVNAGYKNVRNVGGIGDARKLRAAAASGE
jgi:phage shock protein E